MDRVTILVCFDDVIEYGEFIVICDEDVLVFAMSPPTNVILRDVNSILSLGHFCICHYVLVLVYHKLR